MIFFDFLNYLICKFYASYKEKGALSTAAGIVGGFQAMNVLTIFFLFSLFNNNKILLNKIYVIFLVVFFQITTYIRYIYKEAHSVGSIEKKWKSKTESYRKKTLFLLWLYGIISIISAFGLAIYLGSVKK